jgi:DNA processing protein
VKGDLKPQLHKRILAVVGSRNASANGFHFARTLAKQAGEQGLCIVSGLARGIDTAAHKGALETGTVAVIAGGIDNIYPPENEGLYKSIVENGAIVTEHPFGMAPHSRSFPSRNRIISGIGMGTLVVEASLKSGSLITARYAADQGRDVFAVPGSPLDPRCRGTNDLLRNGAILTESLEDILPQLRAPSLPLLQAIEEEEHTAYITDKHEQMPENARETVEAKLSPNPVLIDELLQQCHITPPALWPVLLELELAGRLQRHPGNKVSLRIND